MFCINLIIAIRFRIGFGSCAQSLIPVIASANTSVQQIANLATGKLLCSYTNRCSAFVCFIANSNTGGGTLLEAVIVVLYVICTPPFQFAIIAAAVVLSLLAIILPIDRQFCTPRKLGILQ